MDQSSCDQKQGLNNIPHKKRFANGEPFLLLKKPYVNLDSPSYSTSFTAADCG